MKHSLNYLFFISVLMFFSCTDTQKIDEETLPIVGSWNLIDYEFKTVNPPTDWIALDEECRWDDIEEFKSNGTWTRYDGTYQCSGGNGTGIYNGTWRLTSNNRKVIFTYQGVPGEYESTVEELTDTFMVLTFATGSTDGRQNRVTYSKN